ncbi:unnamed protein product [Caenorhabditis auriculariae]|uniref:PPM-type phosphatase domain-containing protein n=1 Tax=Caenorhabditis auriculariae TaxID=2777116 RepID=A0A8S1H434_9PELO|nr:unnamed protein product [Caenorhabditis auriculariae]
MTTPETMGAGDHLKSFIEHLQDAFEEELDTEMSRTRNRAVMRYRPPYTRLPQHDLRGDAINLVYENMLTKLCPPEIAHTFAVAYVDFMADQLNTRKVSFQEDVYNTVDVSAWCKQVMDGMFPFAKKIISGEIPTIELPDSIAMISTESMRGRRAKQEDRFVAYTTGTTMDPNFEDKVGLFGVFDGHGGAECAIYAAAHLAEEWMAVRAEKPDLETSLSLSLKNLDRRMTVRSEKEQWRGGTTAVVLAVSEDELAFAWLGDSPGYLMSPSKLEKITRNHSPSDPDEARRVEEAGGQLLFIQGEMRVNGVLNLTRALGDVSGRPMISNEPELKTVKREKDQYMAVLACDGITDVFSTEEILRLIETFIANNDLEDYYELAMYICRQAVDRGSADNVTVIVVFLRSPDEIWELMKTEPSDPESSSSSSTDSPVSDPDSDTNDEESDQEKLDDM